MPKINIEYFFEVNRGYIFHKNNLENISILIPSEIISFKFNKYFSVKQDLKLENLLKNNIFCFCKGKNMFAISQYNRLPSERWEEFIDTWSCHNNEFDTSLNNQLLVRKNGILYSHFYFLVDEFTIPSCCRHKYIKYYKNKIRVIYFNEVFLNFNYEISFYNFFKEYFAENQIFTFKNIELKFFGSPSIQLIGDDVFYNSIKVGYKILPYENDRESVLSNKYFYELSIVILKRNSIGRSILSYELSYFINYN